MSATILRDLANRLNGQILGDDSLEITGADILRDAQPGQISFATSDKYKEQIEKSQAAAVIVPRDFACETRTVLQVDDVLAAFAEVASLFRPTRDTTPSPAPRAKTCHPSAKIAADVVIGAGATVGPDVVLEEGVVLYPGVCIMAGTTIGAYTKLFPNAVVYENCQIGQRCLIHANAVIGAYGFGYESSSGKHELSPQVGNVVIEDDVEVGAGTTIDRATFGSTRIGAGTKIDNLVMIGHNCRIGKHNLLCSQVGIAGSCTTGDYVVMAGQVGIGDHLDIESKAVLAAKAGVMNSIPADETWVGIPATPMRVQLLKQAALAKLPEMRKQFKQLKTELSKMQSKLNELTDSASDDDTQPTAIDPPLSNGREAA